MHCICSIYVDYDYMTASNPHPLANPLNQGRFKNCGLESTSSHGFSIGKTGNAKDLTVPDSMPYSEITARSASSNLTVPNQDVPYCSGPVNISGFLGNSTLLQLSDGSVIDLKKRKIVLDPNIKWKAQGYWNDPNAATKKLNVGKEWGRTESIESLMDRVIKHDGTYYDPNLSPESIKYWQKANEESKKLEQNLTDEQKSLLADLHDGKMFPLSKLVEEK